MRRTALYIAAMVITALGVSPAHPSPFPSNLEPGTERRVYQITSEPGYNNALYFHQSNTDGALALVYANVGTLGQVSTLTHRTVDLESGTDSAIHTTGKCSGGAFVRDQYLYCFHRDSPTPGTPFKTVARYHLRTFAGSDLCTVSDGWTATGSITVNLDGSYLIFMQEQLDPGGVPVRRQAFRCHIASGTRTLLMDSDSADISPLIEHFQFHTAHPMWFTYYDRGRARRLSRIGVGRIDTLQYSPLHSSDPFFESDPADPADLFPADPDGPDPNGQDFLHPVYAQDGSLWSDVIDLYDGSKPRHMVRFTLDDAAPGTVSGHSLVSLAQLDWQLHYNAGHDSLWFVGDGSGTSTGFLGEKYIQRLMLDAWTGGPVVRERLADGVGTDDPKIVGGVAQYLGPNAHYIPSKRWVVWSAYRTLTDTQNPALYENVFAVDYNPPVDVDQDGVPDHSDNCTLYANPAQTDADFDGFGNRCDPDIDQSQVIDSADSAIVQACIDAGGTVPLSSGGPAADPTCEISDLDESGTIDIWDLVVVLQLYNQGKIGPTCGGNGPCFP